MCASLTVAGVLSQVGQTTGAVKTARLSQFLQEVFRADTDLHTLRVAALTLGRLVKAGGPVTAEVVDSEVPCMLTLTSTLTHAILPDKIACATTDQRAFTECSQPAYIRQHVSQLLLFLFYIAASVQLVGPFARSPMHKNRGPCLMGLSSHRLGAPEAAATPAQVRRAILWLRDERADHLRYAGSLVLRQVRLNIRQSQGLPTHAIPAR